MSRLFILEGCDCCGKTTLAKHMVKMLRAGYIHATRTPEMHQGMSAFHKEILVSAAVMLENQLDVVLDRHWPSEWCYSRALNREYNAYGIGEMFDWIQHAVMNGHRITYIFAMDSGGYDRQLVSQDKSHPYSADEYRSVEREYELLFRMMSGETLLGRVPISHFIQAGNAGTKTVKYELAKHGPDMNAFIATLL